MCPLTGNNAETGLDNRITAETAEIEFYNDLNHNNPEVSGQKKNPYPIWMDTPGNDLSKKRSKMEFESFASLQYNESEC